MKVKKGFSLLDIVLSAVCLAPVLAGALFYAKLPEDLAVHFRSGLDADSFVNKNVFLFAVPVIFALLEIGSIAARAVKDPLHADVVWLKLLLPAIDYFLFFIVIGNALGVLRDPGFIVCAVFAYLMLLAGAVIPRIGKTPNWVLKVLPTLKNGAVLFKTQEAAGTAWVCASAILMAVSFLGSLAAPFAVILLCLMFPAIYSVAAYHSEYSGADK